MKTVELIPILRQLPYFTKQNLSLILKKEEEGLNYWISKLIKEEVLIPLKKGFYISSYYRDLLLQNPDNIDAYFEYLANLLRFPSYVSLEYVLDKYSFIPESVFSITSVSLKTPRIYTSKITTFIYRNIKEELFLGWALKDFKDKKIKIASLAKALFDFFYLKRLPAFQWKEYLLETGRFNWSVLTASDKKEFISFVRISNSVKMTRIINILKKEKIL